jgi:hypothetical protein
MVMDLKWLDHLELLDYNLPNDFIALHPVSPRDHSKLLYYNHGDMSDFQFTHGCENRNILFRSFFTCPSF